MSIVLQIIAAILPAILLFVYVWKQDAKPEPTRLLLKAVLLGALICIPCSVVEFLVSEILPVGNVSSGAPPPSFWAAMIVAFFVAALPEELCKLFVLDRTLRNNPYYDEHYDGIVYAVCVGLGFAAFENIFYVIGSGEMWVQAALSRALLAIPGHYAFAVVMGYFYSVYHFTDSSKKAKYRILWVPVVAHGIYDTIALSSTLSEKTAAICMLVLIVFCIFMQKFAKKKLVAMVEKDKNENATVIANNDSDAPDGIFGDRM